MSEPNQNGRLFDVGQLSAYLSLPTATIYTWVHLRRIPGVVRLGRALRFDRAAIDRWVESRRAEGPIGACGAGPLLEQGENSERAGQ